VHVLTHTLHYPAQAEIPLPLATAASRRSAKRTLFMQDSGLRRNDEEGAGVTKWRAGVTRWAFYAGFWLSSLCKNRLRLFFSAIPAQAGIQHPDIRGRGVKSPRTWHTPPFPLFFPSFRGFPRHSGLFFCHSGASRNPSFYCDLGIAKEREARAFPQCDSEQ